MPIRTLGRVLFPRQQAWQRERFVKHVLIALAVAVIFAAIVAGMMFLINSRPQH
jgi:hypothetical protein